MPEAQATKVMVFVNDKDGRLGTMYAEAGHKVYVYHKAHDNAMDVTVYPNRGSLTKVGDDLDVFLEMLDLAHLQIDTVGVMGPPSPELVEYAKTVNDWGFDKQNIRQIMRLA